MSDSTTTREPETPAQRWRASLGLLDKVTDDDRLFTGTWHLGAPGPLHHRQDDGVSPSHSVVGTVDTLTVEGGRLIALGEVWDGDLAAAMFAGKLRPEAGFVADGGTDLQRRDDREVLVISGGRLAYVMLSDGPGLWGDGETWFVEDTTGGTS